MPWLLNVRLALGLCTLLSSQTGLQAAGAAALPPLPSWARGPGYRGSGQWKDFAIKQNKQNQAVVDKVDAEGKTFDIILYGESITQLIYRQSKAEWAALFPPSQGWVGAPLGVSGNDIEDLTWRIIAGSERPKRAPRCIALLIGTNDVNAGVPVDKIKLYMDYLLRYLKAAFPTTKIILWKMLPREGLNMAPANAAYLALARKHNATWITCGQYLDARNPAVLYDGTHPTPATQTQLLRCLAPTVYKLVGKGPRRLPPRRPPPRAPSKRTGRK